MKRVVEPELMEDENQAKAYAEADFSLSDHLFVESLKRHLCGFGKDIDAGTLFLDLGCGPGNIAERISTTWPDSRVCGIDGSEPMLCLARKRQREKKISKNNLSYKALNIKGLVNPLNEFTYSANVLVSNSLLHHLHDPGCLWLAIKNVCVPGAMVQIRDLRRPQSKNEAIALQQKYLSEAPDVLIRDYLASLQAAFTVDEVQIQLQEADLVNLSVSEIEDRYLEVIGTL